MPVTYSLSVIPILLLALLHSATIPAHAETCSVTAIQLHNSSQSESVYRYTMRCKSESCGSFDCQYNPDDGLYHYTLYKTVTRNANNYSTLNKWYGIIRSYISPPSNRYDGKDKRFRPKYRGHGGGGVRGRSQEGDIPEGLILEGYELSSDGIFSTIQDTITVKYTPSASELATLNGVPLFFATPAIAENANIYLVDVYNDEGILSVSSSNATVGEMLTVVIPWEKLINIADSYYINISMAIVNDSTGYTKAFLGLSSMQDTEIAYSDNPLMNLNSFTSNNLEYEERSGWVLSANGESVLSSPKQQDVELAVLTYQADANGVLEFDWNMDVCQDTKVNLYTNGTHVYSLANNSTSVGSWERASIPISSGTTFAWEYIPDTTDNCGDPVLLGNTANLRNISFLPETQNATITPLLLNLLLTE